VPQRSVGRSVPLRGASEVVTGRLRYLTDLTMPDMLQGKVVRSRVPHGLVRRVEVRLALAVPGVVAVLTAKDVPDNVSGIMVPDWPVLAGERVRQVGEPIALVAAETLEAAEAGARAVLVEIEQLPVVNDPELALGPDAPKLHEGGNLLAKLEHEKGDVERALAEADLVIDRVVETPSQEHVCLEPGGGVATYAEGRITIWCGCQSPGTHLREVARALKVDPDLVRLISTPMGGAFGSKGDGPLPIHLALLARATGRPVRIVLTREEVMEAGAKRHPFRIHTRLGLTREGEILALDTNALIDTGPYASVGPAVLKVAAEMSTGPYRVPAARFRGRVAYTNNANAGAFRGYGVPQVAYALETSLEVAADRLGLDPVEIRRRNALKPGDEQGLYGHRIGPGLRAAEALERAAAHPWWADRELWRASVGGAWRRGTGIALAIKGVGLGSGRGDAAGARLAISPTGRIRIWAGPNHSGQFIETAYAQIAADVLGLPYGDIEVLVGDTLLVPESGSCAASRSTYAGGSAVRLACEELQARIRRLGLGEPIDWMEAGRRLGAAGEAGVEATFRLPDVEDLGRLRGAGPVEKYAPHLVYGSAAQVARVEVNRYTGEVRVAAVACALDCGVAINPAAVIGQAEGGIVQGMGFGVMEEHCLEVGVPTTRSLETYLIPTAADAPRMEIMLVESGEETGPFGAKGIAEVVCVPTAPAIAAAIRDAVGIMIDRPPATPERVYRLMNEGAV
jgi:CO/xanthine dehydrogenase Mo-binding subunit